MRDFTPDQLVDLVLKAHSDGDAAHWTVRGVLGELRKRRSDTVHYPERSILSSLIHWVSLCQTVKGVTKAQWRELLADVQRQCYRFDLDQPFSSAGAQNWYLNPSIGKVDSLRQSVMDTIPQRSVGCSGARDQSFTSCQRDRGTGPRYSPPTGGVLS